MIHAIYPFATRLIAPHEGAKEPFVDSQPGGVTVHYTADRNVKRVISSLKEKGYNYHLLIDRDGSVIQTGYLDKSVWHAGKAEWNGKSPNKEHASIALVSWGYLFEQDNGFFSWSGDQVSKMDAVKRGNNLQGEHKKIRAWDAATMLQETKLLEVLSWFRASGISPADICGHDECALPAGRKEDPGGVLSMTMAEVRASLGQSFA